MTTRGTTLAALLTALGRPTWWILALAGFLVRGGILLFLVAIVTLPSPLALSNLLGPLITPLYLGRLEPATLALIALAIVVLVVWLVGGGWVAAATEVALVRAARRAAREEGLPSGPDLPEGRLLISRSAAAHLLGLLPTGLVAGLGSVAILDVAYHELVNPTDSGPIVLRVVAGAAGPLAAIVAAWVLGDIAGGLAVRRIVAGGEAVVPAVLHAWLDLVRRPAGSLIVPLVTTGVLLVDLAAALAVVMVVWTEVRSRLVHPYDDPLATGLALATFGGAWCLALLVTGLIDAWRSAAMTFEAGQAAAPAATRSALAGGAGSSPGSPDGGTIGASAHRRPGDWSADDRGGSL